MHGITYPLRAGKQQGTPPTSSLHLPPINTSEKSVGQKPGGRRPSRSATSISKNRGENYGNKTKSKNRGPSSVPVETVMEMNKNAMTLMKDGKLKRSYDTLKSALTAAEAGVRRFQRQAGTSGSKGQEQHEAWLLALAATLSNFGCLRRRDNQLQDAIRYLQDARTVEMQVFGRPSCSTMVNLSAVLLGLGETEEALAIARDCALASEQSDPMLHIIALHNYGVTLNHHAAEEMRQSAAPVLMKALRQAESHLGEDHPTTVLIREHCGMAVRKRSSADTEMHDSEAVTVPSAHRLPGEEGQSASQRRLVDHRSPPPPPTVLPSIHCQRAREALQALDYGKMTLTAESVCPSETEPSASSHTAPTTHSVGSVGRNSSGALPSTTPLETVRREATTPSPDQKILFSEPVSVHCEEVMEALLQTGSIRTTLSPFSQALQENYVVGERMSDGDKHSDVPPDCTAVSDTTNSGMYFDHPHTVDLKTEEELGKTEITEESDCTAKNDKSDQSGQTEEGKLREERARLHEFTMTQKPKASIVRGEYIFIGPRDAQMEPSYYRFASAEPLLAPSVPTVSSQVEVMEPSRPVSEKMFMEFEEDEEEEEEEEESLHVFRPDRRKTREKEKEQEKGLEGPKADPILKMRETFFKTIGVSPVERRQKRIKKEREEEEALCARRRKEAEEAAKKEYFERTLEAIIARTRNRAATKIQNTWCTWWNTVGRRRRELLIKRAEEKARRERSRRALLEHERRVEQLRLAKKMPKKKSVPEIPPMVVRYAKKWLEKTSCVRYMVRCGIGCKGENNTFFKLRIAKIQAAWRGYCTRQSVREILLERAQEWTCRQQVEVREYAALVLQLFFRRSVARGIRSLNAFERYEPRVRRIQRWFRHFMPRRRALGLDKVSKYRREYSARMIQRAWRAYLSRLAHFMASLRYKLDEDRRRERVATQLLQRVGRGFGCRCHVAKRRLQCMNLYTVMHTLECGKSTDGEERASACVVPKISAYVPTPVQEVEAIARLEREKYHIGMFVDVLAARERAEWKEALRLRPFEVLRRRAHEDHISQLELNAYRREWAARKIQKEFRRWLQIRDQPFRDNVLLLISRGMYQVGEYDKKIRRIRHEREQEEGRIIYGDQTAPMRAAKAKAREELEEVRPLVRTHVPLEEVRGVAERCRVEAELQRDERLLEKQLRSEGFAKKRESRLHRAIKTQLAHQATP